MRGAEDAAGGARFSPALRTAHLPGRSPRRDARRLGNELSESREPASRGWWWLREPAAGQRCRSGLSAASSAEPGRPQPRPVSSPPRARAALEQFQCRIEGPPRGGNSEAPSQFWPLVCAGVSAVTHLQPLQHRNSKPGAPGGGGGGGRGLLRRVMFLESCSWSWRCVGDCLVRVMSVGDSFLRVILTLRCVCCGGSSWHLAQVGQ